MEDDILSLNLKQLCQQIFEAVASGLRVIFALHHDTELLTQFLRLIGAIYQRLLASTHFVCSNLGV
jgi:hypothetical protein